LHTKEDRPDVWPYILTSMLAHLLLLIIVPMIILVPRMKEDEIMEIIPLNLDSKSSYRIADIQEPKHQIRPDKAKLLGMYNSRVKRETVATGLSRGKSNRGKGRDSGGKKKSKRKSNDKLLSFDPKIFKKGYTTTSKKKGGEEGRRAQDFYPDFRRGANTYLNVLRYPEIEYFVRMKRAFKVTFNPGPTLRTHFMGNHVARGSIDVVLGVSVNRAGELAELFIFRSSDVPAYDREAMRTVRASAPFSTPPEKFVEDDGLLRMSWTFSVYL
jgi:TonB family protein